jgi:hypothetical protein
MGGCLHAPKVPQILRNESRSLRRFGIPSGITKKLDILSFVMQRPLLDCHRPLDLWLAVAALTVSVFVLAFVVGRYVESGDNWWFVEPHTGIAKKTFKVTWTGLLPFLCIWTGVGFTWLAETLNNTPDCFTTNVYVTPTMCALSQVLCSIAIIGYSVFVANVWEAERCRKANTSAIRVVQDADLVNRWGQLQPAATMDLCGGLSPEQFADLPRHTIESGSGNCTICLSPMEEGDHGRCLPGCEHVFHRACIDLWLLRRASCPLCKVEVSVAKAVMNSSGRALKGSV